MHSPQVVDIGVIVLSCGMIVGFVVLAFETRVQSRFFRKRRHQMSLRSAEDSQRFLRGEATGDRSAC
ncbi:hypothetical protein SAMN03159423_4813 [Bradyrhizobium sp. NFR13]|nr:hypothetical protein SAMN03159423_4813 [Bradyrhizobium sp. NFR13]